MNLPYILAFLVPVLMMPRLIEIFGIAKAFFIADGFSVVVAVISSCCFYILANDIAFADTKPTVEGQSEVAVARDADRDGGQEKNFLAQAYALMLIASVIGAIQATIQENVMWVEFEFKGGSMEELCLVMAGVVVVIPAVLAIISFFDAVGYRPLGAVAMLAVCGVPLIFSSQLSSLVFMPLFGGGLMGASALCSSCTLLLVPAHLLQRLLGFAETMKELLAIVMPLVFAKLEMQSRGKGLIVAGSSLLGLASSIVLLCLWSAASTGNVLFGVQKFDNKFGVYKLDNKPAQAATTATWPPEG